MGNTGITKPIRKRDVISKDARENLIPRAAGSMSDDQRAQRVDLPPCARCRARMHEVVSIAPALDEPGLIAYECPNCGHVMSVLVQPAPPNN